MSFDRSIPSRFRPWDENEWRSRFFPLALTPKPETGFGENRMGTRLSWRLREKTRESRQNSRLATGLGKIDLEPVYLGDFPRKRGNHAKTGHLRPVWGKSQRNPFIMAIVEQNAIRLAKPFGSAKPCGLVKQEGMPLIVRAIDDKRPQIWVSPFIGVETQ